MVRFIMIAVIVLAACGGDDEPSEGEKACAELEDKLASCRFTNRGKCNTGDPCAVRCAVMADCAQGDHRLPGPKAAPG